MFDRHGENWTPEEMSRLVTAFDAGASLAELVEAHGRTGGALAGKLTELKRLIYVDRSRSYHRLDQAPFITKAEIDGLREAEKGLKAGVDSGLSFGDLLDQRAALGLALLFRLKALGCLLETRDAYVRIHHEPHFTSAMVKKFSLP